MRSILILAVSILAVIKSNAALRDYLKDSNSVIIKTTHLEAENACLASQSRLPTAREVLASEGLKIIESKYPQQSIFNSANSLWIFEEWNEMYKIGFIPSKTFNSNNYYYDQNTQFDLQNSYIQFYYNAADYAPTESGENYWTADTHHINVNGQKAFIYFNAETKSGMFPARLFQTVEDTQMAVRCIK